MNKLIEKIPGSVLNFVYVGGNCLFVFLTNQEAWKQLSGLVTLQDRGLAWPEEVYLVLAYVNSTEIKVPQIGHVVISEDNELKYKELWGEEYDAFSKRVMEEWPIIKESLSVGELLRI